MIVVRPVIPQDSKQLFTLATEASVGITSLPKNKKSLEMRIELSVKSFKKKVTKPSDELYFFVMEDQESKHLAGCSAIKACVGDSAPFYSYKLSNITQCSKSLGCRFDMGLLTLVNDYQGVAEVMSLYVDRKIRQLGLGKLLSLSRFLFIAEQQHRFPDTVIAELRGVSDAAGTSPFWESVGKHFFNMDFASADYMTGLGNKDFIAELMPRYPIYTCLLPQEVQAIIGVAHVNSQAAQKILQTQGFQYHHYVDIFDAGPTWEVNKENIKFVQHSQVSKISKIMEMSNQEEEYILASGTPHFRACLGAIKIMDDGTCCLGEKEAKTLQLSMGESIRYYR
jgi:arginine N-succinyltransferase